MTDINRVHQIIKEAYRNDGQLDGLEMRDLEREGLNEDQVRLIRDTIFIESAGEVDEEELPLYKSAGLEDLAKLLQEKPPLPTIGIRYYGGVLNGSLGRFVFQDPTKVKGPYPNDGYMAFGVDIVLGLGRRDVEEPMIRRPLQLVGELQLSFFGGRVDDRLDLTQEAREILHDFTAQAETELEREIEEETGVPIDLDLSQIDLGELVAHRQSTFFGGLIQWRRLLIDALPVNRRWSFFDIYIHMGMGAIYTTTDVHVLGQDSNATDLALVGRLAGEMDAAKLTLDDWILALRGGVGLTAGGQGGADAFLGLAVLHRR